MILFQVIADRLFGPGPKLETLAQNYSLVLSNSHFSINEVRPLVPALVEVGGLHLDESQKLQKVSYLLPLVVSTENEPQKTRTTDRIERQFVNPL